MEESILNQPVVGKYRKVKKIGEGSYGVVYKATHVDTQKIYAVKKVKMPSNQDEGIPSYFLREISLLKWLRHPHIIQLEEIVKTTSENELYLIFEFVEKPLSKVLEEKRYFPINPYLCRSMMLQLLEGLNYLHINRVVHRDIKPDNLLIDSSTATLKIADFGLAKRFVVPSRSHSSQVQTLWYRAPELILGDRNYGPEIDIWGAGCVFFELLTGSVLFRNDTEIGTLFEMFKVLGTPKESEWKELSTFPHYKASFPRMRGAGVVSLCESVPDTAALDLLSLMLRFCPKQRPSAKYCLQHPYFTGVQFN